MLCRNLLTDLGLNSHYDPDRDSNKSSHLNLSLPGQQELSRVVTDSHVLARGHWLVSGAFQSCRPKNYHSFVRFFNFATEFGYPSAPPTPSVLS